MSCLRGPLTYDISSNSSPEPVRTLLLICRRRRQPFQAASNGCRDSEAASPRRRRRRLRATSRGFIIASDSFSRLLWLSMLAWRARAANYVQNYHSRRRSGANWSRLSRGRHERDCSSSSSSSPSQWRTRRPANLGGWGSASCCWIAQNRSR